MHLITDKDVFNFVSAKLLEQGSKSMDTFDTCQYRGIKYSLMLEVQRRIMNKFDLDEDSFDSIFENNEMHDEYIDLLCSLNADAKCAVGHLILDEYYHASFEGSQIEDGSEVWEAVKDSNPEWIISDYSFRLLQKLQDIHDRNDATEWKSKFEQLSHCFNDKGEYDMNLLKSSL